MAPPAPVPSPVQVVVVVVVIAGCPIDRDEDTVVVRAAVVSTARLSFWTGTRTHHQTGWVDRGRQGYGRDDDENEINPKPNPSTAPPSGFVSGAFVVADSPSSPIAIGARGDGVGVGLCLSVQARAPGACDTGGRPRRLRLRARGGLTCLTFCTVSDVCRPSSLHRTFLFFVFTLALVHLFLSPLLWFAAC